jgi:serine/threonine protein kinase HipA of HipAB toxin-antitoxin module
VVGYLGGERPKFTAFTGMDHVLVKFSPKLDSKDVQALRYKDLLVCEQIALQTLSQAGLVVAQAKLVQSDRLYLQFKRFDRVNGKGRKGVLTLAALQQAYGLNSALSWPLVADQLFQQNVISDENRQVLHFVYAFAQLIGHKKMDARNLAFYFEEGKVLGLAPIYDVWPSRLWSESDETSKSDWTPPLLFDVEPRIAQQAKDLASYYYKRVFENYLVSYETKKRFNGL